MPLRIRCPKCGTVQRIPTGVRPTCQKCGFAGNSAEPKGGTEQASGADAGPAADPGQVSWAKEGQVAWDAAPGPGAPPPAAADAGWGDAAWPQADAPEAPKKKGMFGRGN